MERRVFLTKVGYLSITGRTVARGEAPGKSFTPPDSDPASSGTAPVETGEPTGTPPTAVLVEHVPSELVEYEQFGETNTAVRGVLENASDRPLSYVEASARFLDDTDTIIGQGYTNITPLLSGRRWKYNVDYYSPADVPRSEVLAFELSAEYTEGNEPLNSRVLEVVESEMVEEEQFGESTKVVRGTVRNVGDSILEYVEVDVHFLDRNAVVIGEFFSNTENLRPGQGWTFQVDYYSETDTPASHAVDYDIFATS